MNQTISIFGLGYVGAVTAACLAHIENGSAHIRDSLASKDRGDRPHLLICRSTMLPGATRIFVRRCFQGLVAFGATRVRFDPEFLRQDGTVGSSCLRKKSVNTLTRFADAPGLGLHLAKSLLSGNEL